MGISQSTPTPADFSRLIYRFKESIPQEELSLSSAVSPSLMADRFKALLSAFPLDGTPISTIPELDIALPDLDPVAGQTLLKRFKQAQSLAMAELAKHPKKINVWEPAGLEANEVRNCKVLAWFLDPNASHGQGTRFLRCMIDNIKVNEVTVLALEKLAEQVYHVRTESWLSSDSRIDIEVIGSDLVLVIEAKVGAPPDRDQLERYWKIAKCYYNPRQVIGLFLTVDGHIEVDGHAFEPIYWKNIVEAARRFAGQPSNENGSAALNENVRWLAEQYATFIQNNIAEE